MWSGIPLLPQQASTMAARVDALYFFLIAVSSFFSLLIAGLIVYYAVKYRRRSAGESPKSRRVFSSRNERSDGSGSRRARRSRLWL